MPNQLIRETSPYLLQHAHNPVNWMPWSKMAFTLAKQQHKPVFLSIGYSTCHWCHVMEQESFLNEEIARLLNTHFISIKVDREERPDIDAVYMTVCQSMTGSGGWPLTIIMTPDQLPFFAATYIPPLSRYGIKGLAQILAEIIDQWEEKGSAFARYGKQLIAALSTEQPAGAGKKITEPLPDQGFTALKASFDPVYGGFGKAPKFPMPHNIMFLLKYYSVTHRPEALEMAEKTLAQLYRGGIFDHIGFGFSRYSTDDRWEIPHFEKMLYDNALLIYAYSYAYQITDNTFYRNVAEKTAEYVFTELTDPHGGFYCAQDADSDGQEGRFYAFTATEIQRHFPADAEAVIRHFSIAAPGNFEGRSVPTLLHNPNWRKQAALPLEQLRQYRKQRAVLHKDDKVLVSWNGLMIAALSYAAKILDRSDYIEAAERATNFILCRLSEQNRLYNSYREGQRSRQAFIEDYAFFIWGQAELYLATLKQTYLDTAKQLLDTALAEFWDYTGTGFFLSGKNNETLPLRPKEAYDGAQPSANSVMVYNLFLLSRITKNPIYEKFCSQQIAFMEQNSSRYPQGFSFFLFSLLYTEFPPTEITCVLKEPEERKDIVKRLPPQAIVSFLDAENKQYPLLNDQTTYYVCQGNTCHAPANQLKF